MTTAPGWEGTIGPFPAQYKKIHVYARDIYSGAGNCVCGSALGDWCHIQAAPGVNIPASMRVGNPPIQTGWCYLCPTPVRETNILSHMREHHPEHAEVDRWPDGSPLIVDLAPDPSEYGTSP